MPNTEIKPVFLCVANWDSNVGYAWWLMESFWLQIHERFKHDYRVTIAYPSISKLPAHIDASSISKELFDFHVSSIESLLAHCRFIREHNVRVIYFSDRPTSHWSYLLFRLCGVKKIIVHDHTPGTRTRPHGLRKLFKIIRARLPYFRADAAIGATEYVKQRLININCFPATRCFSAPNGLPKLAGVPKPIDLHAQLSLHPDTVLIVSTGRATLYKGVDFALDVIARLVNDKQYSYIHYLYCGDGPDLSVLQAKAKTLRIDQHVTFLGRVNNIDAVLAGCDIAFHPSRGEVGYSLSILEYMRVGLPVIISDNPSVCESITHEFDGIIYREGDVASAVSAFEELLADKNRLNLLGLRGKETVQNKYSLDNTHQCLIRALEITMEVSPNNK